MFQGSSNLLIQDIALHKKFPNFVVFLIALYIASDPDQIPSLSLLQKIFYNYFQIPGLPFKHYRINL